MRWLALLFACLVSLTQGRRTHKSLQQYTTQKAPALKHDQAAQNSIAVLLLLAGRSPPPPNGRLSAATHIKRKDVLLAFSAAAAAACGTIVVDPRVVFAETDAQAVGRAAQERARQAKEREAARKLRASQCETERKILKSKSIESTDIMPASDDPSQPASCVGYSLYRSTDPKLDQIYEMPAGFCDQLIFKVNEKINKR